MGDPDGNGMISLQDFVRAKTVAKLQLEEEKMIKEQFDHLTKGQKSLKSDDFRAWMKENDARLTDHQFDSIMNNVDADKNGIIDYEEFENAMKSVDDLTTMKSDDDFE